MLFRPGARYTCFGDGLCCTDIHSLGPLTAAEGRFVESLKVGAFQTIDGERMLTIVGQGCVFLNEAGCQIHGEQGPEAKPEGCIRFPYRLVATPDGGRVSTHHRCPCRTMGNRPPMDEADARMSLRGGKGRLRADRDLDTKVPITKRKHLSFSKWKEIEERIFAEPAKTLEQLDPAAFPSLGYRSWAEAAQEILDGIEDSSRFTSALRWFAHAILDHEGRAELRPQERPWSANFEKGAARSDLTERKIDDLLEDWLLDEFWSLEWATDSNLAHAWCEWATLASVARAIAANLESHGIGSEQAAAEAMCVVDTVSASEHWADIEEDFVVDEKLTIAPWVLRHT